MNEGIADIHHACNPETNQEQITCVCDELDSYEWGNNKTGYDFDLIDGLWNEKYLPHPETSNDLVFDCPEGF
jgi:hypothetical protein